MTNPPRLVGADGRPIASDGGMLLPHARTFASIWNAVSKTYSYRFDEAIRDGPDQAMRMARDPFIRALREERKAPIRNLDWAVEVADPDRPEQADLADRLTDLLKRTPRFTRLRSYLLNAVYYGRYGGQVRWGTTPGRPGIVVQDHMPVNGDKVQFAWDGTPVILTGQLSIDDLERQGFEVVMLDRGGRGVKLSDPMQRNRFVVHTHEQEDADFFEGEMAGSARGVGLRGWTYWYYYLRDRMLEAVVGVLQTTGTADILTFNYDEASSHGRKQAEANAAAITGRMAIAVPRRSGSNFPAIETLTVATGGADLLKTVIFDVVDRYIERLYVGQSMSAGADDSNGLGGSGRAELAESTKDQLLVSDADYLSETLTTDLLLPLLRFNFGSVPFDVRFRLLVGDPKAERRLEAAKTLVGLGVTLKMDEARALTDFAKPGPDDETVGGRQALPGQDGAQPRASGGAGSDARAGRATGAGGRDEPVRGMGELVAAMVEAAAEGDRDAVHRLAELGQDPDALAGAIDDIEDGADDPDVVPLVLAESPLLLAWAAGRTRTGKVKAVGSAEHQGRMLYGKKAEAALRGRSHKAGETRKRFGEGMREHARLQEPHRQAAREAWARATADPGSVRPEHLESLADHLLTLTRDELRRTARDMQHKTGGKLKREIVDGLLAHVRQQTSALTKIGPKPKAARKKSDGLARQFVGYGINPADPAFLKFFSGVREAMERGLPLGLFNKSSTTRFDVMARELEAAGHFTTPDGKDADQHLADLLEQGAKTDLADRTEEYAKAEEEHYRNLEEAYAARIASGDIEAAERVGEEEGRREGEAGEGGGDGEGADPQAGDVSFDFGHNSIPP